MWSIGLRINRHLFARLQPESAGALRCASTSCIDRTKVPKLDETDLEEHFISGSGPGGQNVNKAVNCCQLKHIPTGIVVKVHQQRELEKNRKIARELMIKKLDNHYNGEESVENQEKRITLQKLAIRDEQQKQKRLMKEQYKKNLMAKQVHDGENKSSPVDV